MPARMQDGSAERAVKVIGDASSEFERIFRAQGYADGTMRPRFSGLEAASREVSATIAGYRGVSAIGDEHLTLITGMAERMVAVSEGVGRLGIDQPALQRNRIAELREFVRDARRGK
ncbi:MAG: hypothetical protein KGH72_05775 [Candidatus Micrarchaeota archaeon]|nr:hypothetical protein [Candidatus Micrarchaeota archaeon]